MFQKVPEGGRENVHTTGLYFVIKKQNKMPRIPGYLIVASKIYDNVTTNKIDNM